jgi:hypothetical protein
MKNERNFDKLTKVEERSSYKVETRSRNYNCEFVRTSKI